MAQDIMAGRVDAAFSSFTGIFRSCNPAGAAARYRQARALQLSGPSHCRGNGTGIRLGGWFGFVAPAKVPKEIITILNREANAAMKRPDVRAKLEALGLDL